MGLHPSQAYEIAFHLVALVLLWRWRRAFTGSALPGQVNPGSQLFVFYLTAYAIFRFLVEFVRGNEIAWMGLTRPQLVLAISIPLLLWRSWRLLPGTQNRRGHEHPTA